MWRDVVWLVKNAPRHFFRVLWTPSHLMDKGNEEKLRLYLEAGGSLDMAMGNAAADTLANAGADLAAPPASVLIKDRFVQILAKKVQATDRHLRMASRPRLVPTQWRESLGLMGHTR